MAKGVLLTLGIALVLGIVWLVLQGSHSRPSFSLQFFAGGSITGHSFEVIIRDTVIHYKETEPSEQSVVQTISRELTSSELQTLQATLEDIDILHVPSQDFGAEEMGHDRGRYTVSVLIDGKDATIECTIPPPFGTLPATRMCQEKMNTVRDTLNEILGVSIY